MPSAPRVSAAEFAAEVAAYIAANPAPEVVEILSTDINGIFRGKQYPAQVLDKIATDAVQFPMSTLLHDAQGGIPQEVLKGHREGDPDASFFPVAGTLRPVPWAEKPTAQLLVMAYDRDGEPEAADPRQVLAHVVDQFALRGLKPVIAIELEFILLSFENGRPVPTAPSGPFPALTGPQCLSMEALADYAPFVRQIEEACIAQDIPITSILSEYGDGQLEANLEHRSALKAADDSMCLKRVVKSIAREHGWLASFMAKPFADATGNGLHVHVSVLNEQGKNIFGDPKNGEDKLRHAVGGVLDTLSGSMAILAPNANSYRRFRVGNFVPMAGTWGENHRAVAIRLPLAGPPARRLEHRVAGADACPYLAAAVVLAGMLHGLDNAVDPTLPPVEEGGTVQEDVAHFPLRWLTAIEALEGCAPLKHYLGEEAVDIYTRTKRNEEERVHAEVTDRDYDWYLRNI